MTMKRALTSFLAIAAVMAATAPADAGTAIMASTGRPWAPGSANINGLLANFTVSDATVCATNSGSWVIGVPVPTSTGTVTHTVTADFGPGATVQAWSFNSNGTAFIGRNVPTKNTNATIEVPANGSLFIKGILSSALAPACISTVVLVN